MNQKLVEDNMNLVYFLINRYYPTFIHDEDLAQWGMIGLCKAAEKFDETKGITFSTFASSCILNEFCKEFKRRKRHNGVVSLEYNLFNDEGEMTTVGNFVVGEDDVDYVDDENFYKKLSPLDREIIELRKLGFSRREIAHKFDVSEQTISKHLIIMRNMWRKMYGN